MLITVKARIHADEATLAVLRDAMLHATKVYNRFIECTTKAYKETGKIYAYRAYLNRAMVGMVDDVAVYGAGAAQATRDEVIQAWRNALSSVSLHGCLKIPQPRQQSVLSPLRYNRRVLKIVDNNIVLPFGGRRKDGIRNVIIRVSCREKIDYNRIHQLLIVHNKELDRLEARLVVHVEPKKPPGKARVALCLSNPILFATIFSNGVSTIYSGRLIRSVLSRRWKAQFIKSWPKRRKVLRKIDRQVDHLLHIATSHFIEDCVFRKVGSIVFGRIPRERTLIDGPLFVKIQRMLQYKAGMAGIKVARIVVGGISRRCHACGKVNYNTNSGLHKCPHCKWVMQADINRALNIYERAFSISPIKGSNGFMAKPVVLSFRLGWHKVYKPKRNGERLCAPVEGAHWRTVLA